MNQREVIKCPTCGKRVLDIEADECVVLYIKCKHCGKEHRIVWQRNKAA